MIQRTRKDETLLIVDDEDGPRQSLKIVFENTYRILLACSGEEALEIAGENPVSVCILDIRMTGISGVETLKGLKEIDPGIEVLMLTAYETLESARQALRLGAFDYIGKPFNVKVIREAVERAIEKRLLFMELRDSSGRLRDMQSEIENLAMSEEMARTSSQVYAGVLHDINNPLTIIRGYIDMIQDRMSKISSAPETDISEFKQNIDTIAHQVKVCHSISNRHLELLRREAPREQSLPVNVILQDLKELIKVHPTVREGRVEIASFDEKVSLFINGSELMQILLNLVSNALQSSSSTKQIQVNASLTEHPPPPDAIDATCEKLVNVEALAQNVSYLGIVVADQGEGIPTEILNDIFEPYYTTKSSDGGTGLGLAIVTTLLKRNGGVLHLKSQAGRGTTFTVYLPLRTSENQE